MNASRIYRHVSQLRRVAAPQFTRLRCSVNLEYSDRVIQTLSCYRIKFTLTYIGELKSNANARVKHDLRMALQPQLVRAVEQTRLFKQAARSSNSNAWGLLNNYSQRTTLYPSEFFPLTMPRQYGPDVSYSTTAPVELDISLLRPGSPGSILSGGGDIDNRLKTLFDALQVPDNNQIASLSLPVPLARPIICLMLDDKQIVRVNVTTKQRLDVPDDSKEVILIIDVTADENGFFMM